MDKADADRKVLFGILALQNDLIDHQALVRGIQAWVADKQKPTDRVLADQGAIDSETCDLMRALVRRQLALRV
jgi:hypothetical protein